MDFDSPIDRTIFKEILALIEDEYEDIKNFNPDEFTDAINELASDLKNMLERKEYMAYRSLLISIATITIIATKSFSQKLKE